MRFRLWLAVLILVLLFPAASLGRFSVVYGRAFIMVFGPEWVHIVLHIILYAGLSALLVHVLRLRGRNTLFVLLIILAVGISQETIQALSQGLALLGRATLTNATFDLFVDLVGGLLGLAMLFLAQACSRRFISYEIRTPGEN